MVRPWWLMTLLRRIDVRLGRGDNDISIGTLTIHHTCPFSRTRNTVTSALGISTSGTALTE
jgi:hypothetical protein